MTRALHRVSQFWRHASARVEADERAMVGAILGPALGPLFFELPVNDQRHGLDVLTTVRRLEPSPSRLLQQAALVHDAGKAGIHFSIIDRSLTVFLEAVSPRLFQLMLLARPLFARRYAVYKDHAQLGARRLPALGAPDLAAVVAEHHASQPMLDVTRRLQAADRRN